MRERRKKEKKRRNSHEKHTLAFTVNSIRRIYAHRTKNQNGRREKKKKISRKVEMKAC